MIADVKMNPRQHEAWKYLHDDHTKEVLFWGGARWGKSWFWCQWIILEALSKPGSAWLIWRNELKKLKQTTLLTFFEVINSLGLRDEIQYNEPMGMIRFKKQDVIIFLVDLSYQPSDPKYNRLGSYSLTWYFIDEAQEVRKDAIDILRARTSLLSGRDDEGNEWQAYPKALYTCNPDKWWIFHDYWKPYKAGQLGWKKYDINGNERPEYSRCFIPALVSENTLIPRRDREQYIENLKKSDKVTVERMLYGNFDYDESPNRLFNYDRLLDMFWVNDRKGWRRFITCDVSRLWWDMCIIMVWNGYIVEEVLKFKYERTTFTEDEIKRMALKHAVPMNRVIVDEDGVGGGVVDHLWCRGFIANLTAISPISKKYLPERKRNYANLKTQCYDILADRVNAWLISISDASIRELLLEEMDVMCYVDVDKDSRIKITPKDVIKGMIGRSPDYADALMMRMFFDLYMTDADFERYWIYNPHVDEDIFWNKIDRRRTSLNFIQEEWDKLNRQSNTYLAKTETSLF